MAAGEDNVKREARKVSSARDKLKNASSADRGLRQRELNDAIRDLNKAHTDYANSQRRQGNTVQSISTIVGYTP